jgi:transcriptional regulator with XRE-family HTH domain
MQSMGERITLLRVSHKLNQGDVAKKINMSQSGLCSIERGRVLPSAGTLIALARLFGTTTDYILGLEDDPGKKQYLEASQGIRERVEQLENDYRALINGLHNIGRIWRD